MGFDPVSVFAYRLKSGAISAAEISGVVVLRG